MWSLDDRMARLCEDTTSLLREHLRLAGLPEDGQAWPWVLAQSSLGGRGVVATRDIIAGELLFYDVPLVLGPRAGLRCPPLCVGCHQGSLALVPCSRGCGLPVCSTLCEDGEHHVFECQKLKSWGVQTNGVWSDELLRAVIPVRCLSLSPVKRQVLQCLQSHCGPEHAFEIDLLKRHTQKGPTKDEEEFMRLACCVMDANAFETAQMPKEAINNKPTLSTEQERPLNGLTPSLRGLYPIAAMMNHACTPNTRHGYDEKQKMTVRAASLIAAGTEITSSYTSLLWGTSARRHHLKITKNFLCSCLRCGDPQEGGSRLAALKCLTQHCQGSMFPEEPLEANTKWQCEVCGRQVTGRQASVSQAMLGRLISVVDNRNVIQMERFLSQHQRVMPSSNQIVVEMKCNLIRSYGHAKGYSWTEVTMQQLELKECMCRDLLDLLERLVAGQCRMRGLLLYELHCTLMELRHRRHDHVKDTIEQQNAGREALSCLEEAAAILAEDISAPLDLDHRLQTCREAVTTAQLLPSA